MGRIDLGSGTGRAELVFDQSLFYRIVGERTGLEIQDDSQLMAQLVEMTAIKKQFQKLSRPTRTCSKPATASSCQRWRSSPWRAKNPQAKREVRHPPKGHGALHPHDENANPHEITPIVGSEQQSEELVMYLLKEFEENPVKIWDSNISGSPSTPWSTRGCTTSSTACPPNTRSRVERPSSASSTTGATACCASSCSLCRTWKSSKRLKSWAWRSRISPSLRSQRGEGQQRPSGARGAVLAGVGGAAPAAVPGSPCL